MGPISTQIPFRPNFLGHLKSLFAQNVWQLACVSTMGLIIKAEATKKTVTVGYENCHPVINKYF